MKFYSETLNKLFDNETELKKAEKEHEEVIKKAELVKKEKEAAISKEKKELSKAIEDAETKLSNAYADLEVAKTQVKEMRAKFEKDVAKVLEPAEKSVREAQRQKYTALTNFNNKYGTYSVSYTGEKALKEFERINQQWDKLFNAWNWIF